MSQVENMTNFTPGKPTWPYFGMLSLASAGFQVKCIEHFDTNKFVAEPKIAIKEHINDDEIAAFIINESILENESNFALRCLQHPNITFEIRIPSLDDIMALINDGFLVIVNVNYYALLDEDKYYRAFVRWQNYRGQKVSQKI